MTHLFLYTPLLTSQVPVSHNASRQEATTEGGQQRCRSFTKCRRCIYSIYWSRFSRSSSVAVGGHTMGPACRHSSNGALRLLQRGPATERNGRECEPAGIPHHLPIPWVECPCRVTTARNYCEWQKWRSCVWNIHPWLSLLLTSSRCMSPIGWCLLFPSTGPAECMWLWW